MKFDIVSLILAGGAVLGASAVTGFAVLLA